ncbi:MAG: hypothetical protein KatS3mg115_0111 [Candidatus Poribacteria bacterium]|nr:MAG: hypothetical protein KatS3mg115_0111 [Candidatus Poribacteria bacterium]
MRNRSVLGWALVLFWMAGSGWGVTVRNLALPLPGEERGAIEGTVLWEGRTLANTTLYLYRDPELKDLYGAAPLLSDTGRFRLNVEPGRYYLVAVVDRNGSGSFDAGDVMGIYGIQDWSDARQGKRSIEVPAGKKATNVRLHISAVRIEDENGPRIVGINVADPSALALPGTEASGLVTGRALLPPELDLSATPAYVFAYTDLSWTKKVASAPVSPDGTFSIELPPGRYYLSVVVDRNGSNLFDEGDLFGVYGVRVDPQSGTPSSPHPVTVLPDDRVEGLSIGTVAVRTAEGRLRPLREGELQESPPATVGTIEGRVVGAEGQEEWTVVEVYDSPALMSPVASVRVEPDGTFRAELPTGSYYLIANVDRDHNGLISPTDAVGAYGTADILESPPQPVRVEGQQVTVEIRIANAYDDRGQIVRLNPEEQESAPPPSGISGRILWDGQQPAQAWILAASSPDFSDAPIYPVLLDAFGNYRLSLPPGEYYLMAIVEGPGDQQVGMGDGIAVYGTRDVLSGTPQPVTVWEGRVTPYVFFWVRAIATDSEGGYAVLDDGQREYIRRRYGEPNDRFRYTRNGKTIEEWVYWLRGFSFRFVAEGPGWHLDDVERFTPNLEALERLRPEDLDLTPSFVAQSLVPAVVYYTIDHAVWALFPDGSQEPLAPGGDPVPAPGGLICRDESGNVVRIDLAGGSSAVLLPAAMGVGELALSPDGGLIAYTRRGELRFRLLATGEERAPMLPLEGVEGLSWHLDGRVLAFSARDPERPEAGRNLYLYDAASDHLEPLLEGSTEDFSPRWSPTDGERLAFVRMEEGRAQIWTARIALDGKIAEQRLTRFGGEDPSWLPDGSGLVYRTNGQLWTVDLETQTARPLLVNGEPILAEQVAVSPQPITQ